MKYADFYALSSNTSVFTVAWSLLLRLGSQMIEKTEHDDLLEEIRPTMSNFIAENTQVEIVEAMKALAGADPCDLISLIQRSDEIICGKVSEQADICPVCNGAVEFTSAELSETDILRPWQCLDCGATGTAVYYGKFVLHRNTKGSNGGSIYFLPQNSSDENTNK